VLFVSFLISEYPTFPHVLYFLSFKLKLQ